MKNVDNRSKLISKIAVSAALCLGGFGIALSAAHVNKQQIKPAEATLSGTVDALSGAPQFEVDETGNKSIKWTLLHGGITVRLLRNSASVADPGEILFNEVDQDNYRNIKMQTGQMIEIKTALGFKIQQVKFYFPSWSGYTNGSYGSPLVGISKVSNDATYTVNSETKSVTGAYKPTDLLDYVSSQNSYYGFPSAPQTENPYSEMYFQDIYSGASYGKYGREITLKNIDIAYTNDNDNPFTAPDTVTISSEGDATAVAMGETLQLSSLSTLAGESENVSQEINWYVKKSGVASFLGKNCEIAGVDNWGVLHPFSNGTVIVKAISALGSINSNELTITVSGAKSTIKAPVTFYPENMGMERGKTLKNDGYHMHDGFVIETSGIDVGIDVSGKKTRGAIQFESAASYIRIRTNTGNPIKRIRVCRPYGERDGSINSKITRYSDASYSSSLGSSTYDSTDTLGAMTSYTLTSSGATYVSISNMANMYISSITIEFGDTVYYNASNFADFVLGIQPDRDDVNLCTGNSGHYRVVKDKIWTNKVYETFKADFETSEDQTIVKARTRYLAWASAYGDTTPFATTISLSRAPMLNNNSESNQTILIVTCSAILASALFFAFCVMIKRKKEDREF